MNKDVSVRIDILRTVLIAGIVGIHVSPATEIPSPTYLEPSLFLYVKVFFEHTVFRAAVPTLSVISGYLLFRSFAQQSYLSLLRKKTGSLLVPLVIWNLPSVMAIYTLQRRGIDVHGFRLTLYPFNLEQFGDALFGLVDRPANYPLIFIRDLFVCVLISPVSAWLLRKVPYLALVVIGLIAFSGVDIYVFNRPQILFFFFIGGIIAQKGWRLEAIDKHGWYLITIFLLACIGVAYYGWLHLNTAEAFWYRPMLNGLRTLGIFAFWPLAGVLASMPIGISLAKAARYSFFTFSAHAPLMLMLWLGWKAAFGDQLTGKYPMFYFMAPVLGLSLCVLGFRLLHTLSPKFLSLLSGGRVESKSRLSRVSAGIPACAPGKCGRRGRRF